MLPKISLYISLILLTGIYLTAMTATVKYALNHKFDSIFFFNTGAQTLYFSIIAFVTVYIMRKRV